MIADWSGSRVLVTGARGFIAGHLCQRLLHEGASVFGVSSRAQPAGNSPIIWSQVDLTDPAAVTELVRRVSPDAVFHLAGHVTGSQSLGEVPRTFAMNLASTVHLLTATAETGTRRIVLTGSMQEPQAGDLTPCSPYAASKWAGTAYANLFRTLYQLPVAIARPMMVYGPGQWDTGKLLPYLAVSLLKGESPAISSGSRELDWVFVDDVVEGLLAVARCETIDQAIDLGSGQLTSIRAIAERVASLVGAQATLRFGALPDRPFERPRAANIEETRRLIGWSPTIPLEEGLQRTVAWYRDVWSSAAQV